MRSLEPVQIKAIFRYMNLLNLEGGKTVMSRITIIAVLYGCKLWQITLQSFKKNRSLFFFFFFFFGGGGGGGGDRVHGLYFATIFSDMYYPT